MKCKQEMFKSVLECCWFRLSSILLFLNKKDLFERKILQEDLANYFPDFEGNELGWDLIFFHRKGMNPCTACVTASEDPRSAPDKFNNDSDIVGPKRDAIAARGFILKMFLDLREGTDDKYPELFTHFVNSCDNDTISLTLAHLTTKAKAPIGSCPLCSPTDSNPDYGCL